MRAPLLVPLMLLAACTPAKGPATRPKPVALPLQVARAYGFDAWSRVQALRYTWNVRSGAIQVSRRWEWEPATGKVTMVFQKGPKPDQQSGPVTYWRKDRAKHKKTDHRFINDRYWLLFPFHLVWDRSASLTIDGPVRYPIGAGQGRRITVTYPAQGGYTPGNVYEVYLGPDLRIRQWRFLRTASAKKGYPATWETVRQLGPIRVATDHKNATGKFRLWFTDVAVKVDGRWEKLR